MGVCNDLYLNHFLSLLYLFCYSFIFAEYADQNSPC